MSTDKIYDAAEKAARANDETALAKTLEELGSRGWMWGLLETRAHECSQRGDHDIAFRLLRASCDGPSPSLLAWTPGLFRSLRLLMIRIMLSR